MTRVREAGEVEGKFLGRRGDDRVHFPRQGELDRGLDRVSRQPACPDRAVAIVRLLAAALAPGADRYTVRGGDHRDQIPRADQRHLDIGRRLERARDDLRPDAAGVAERNG
jgi:hypothetical protein